MDVAQQSAGSCVCELREELKVFLTNERCDNAELHESDECGARLANLTDIIQHLNELNTRMKAKMKTCSQQSCTSGNNI